MKSRSRKRWRLASYLLACTLLAAQVTAPATSYAASRDAISKEGIHLDQYELEMDVEKPVCLESITVSPEKTEMKVRETQQLTYQLSPTNANDIKSIAWSSSDKAIAAVEEKTGVVTAVAEGSVTITATATTLKGENISESCDLTIVPLGVEDVTINSNDFTLVVGGSRTITATVSPDDATYATVTWTSSDSSVATVENGTVQAKGAGTAVITASCEGGLISDSITVRVSATAVYPKTVELNVKDLWLPYGHPYQFQVTYTESDATETTVKWLEYNNIILVDSNHTISYKPATSYSRSTTVYAQMHKNQYEVIQATCTLSVPWLNDYKLSNYDWMVEDGKLTVERGKLDFTSIEDVPWLVENKCATSITSVELDNTITSIGKNAFNGCSNMTTAVIPASVQSIDSTAFTGCTGLASVTVHEGTPYADPTEAAKIFGEGVELKLDPHTYENGKCSGCGAEEPCDFILDSVSLSLNGDISVNYYVKVADEIAKDTKVKLSSQKFGEKEIVLKDLSLNSDGEYRFSYALPAKGMQDIINLKAYGDKGNLLPMAIAGGTRIDLEHGFDYSVEKYITAASSIFADDPKWTKEYNLMRSIINYGAAAQLHFKYNTSAADLNRTAIEGVTKQTIADYAYQKSGTLPQGVTVTATSLVLEADTSIRIYFSVDADHSVDDYTFMVDGKVFIPIRSGDEYYLTVQGIPAQHVENWHEFSFGDENNQYTMKYSCLSYAYTVLNAFDGTGTYSDLCDLMKTLYRYNEAANIYFDNKSK